MTSSNSDPDASADNIELSAELAHDIRALCQQGYEQHDQGDYKAAIRLFYSAWTQLPKPQTQWRQAGWVLTALGDAYFSKGDFSSGREALQSALHCPEAMGNPIIHLRLGQCLFELGDNLAARAQFSLVIEHGGKALFEQEQGKYAQLLETHAK